MAGSEADEARSPCAPEPAGGAGRAGTPPRRGIRSFARRAGRLTPAQRRSLEALWPVYGIDDWAALDLAHAFGRDAPKVLEVGFGMGDALVTMAVQHPQRDYLGIDVYPPGIGSALRKIAASGVANVRLIRADAAEVLGTLADQSLDGLLVFFPDPWPKKRHHKRRLIQPDFVGMAFSKLKPGGRLELATDWQPYAEQMLSVIEAHGGFHNTAGKGRFEQRPAERAATKFERRGAKLGHAIRDLVFERRADEG